MSTDHSSNRPSVRDIFLHALDKQTPAEREAYLEGACGQDTALRAKVDALMKGHQEDSFLEHPAAEFSKTAVTPASALTEGSGTLIGRYKLLQQLGEGGMGVVYMAEQQEPVTRKVALKIIKLGMDTKQVVARFEAERQALAMMDHPNIARVLDAGATDSGRPYFVMELVRGVPITEYCDKNQLSARERLDLFMQVCQAIQHAHLKGVIHRDIKPSNVMVTLHDGRPVPKVIDFGIAKATNQRLTEKTLFTNYAQMIGTPAYMSPEQAEMSGLDVDTRTDVYALGVLLYELLTGTTPFASEELLNRGYGEMQRIIAEQEPQRPSTRLSTMQNELRTVVAKNRSTDAAALGVLFQGDLDWIVMRCLEKDRTRRYETTNELATDIQRHLRNEPVLARPPSHLYRFQKLARRNKLAFAAAAAIAATLLLGVAISTWQAVRATRAEREQAKLRETAQNSERTAQADRDKALAAQKDAEEQRERVDRERITTQRNLYVANMNLAQQAWEQNNVGRVRQLLEETASHPDRGFEWYHWQRQTHRELRTLRGHAGGVFGVAFSPDGQRIVTGSADRTAKVWEAASGRELLTITNAGLSVVFSPDGKRILDMGLGTEITLWDASTGSKLLVLKGYTNFVRATFTQDGQRIATLNRDNTVTMWEAASGKQLFSITLGERSAQIESMAMSPDSRWIVTTSFEKSAKMWETATGEELLTLDAGIRAVSFSPDSRRIVTGSEDGTAKVWEVANGKVLLTVKAHSSYIWSAAFSPDGQKFLTASADRTARVWDAATGMELHALKGHTDAVRAAFSPDGQWIVTGSLDKTAKIWRAVGDNDALTLKGHTNFIGDVAFSPDGQRIVTGSFDETAKVWDAASGKEVLTLKGHSNAIFSVAFSPDGLRVLTGSADKSLRVRGDKTAKVWDATSGKELFTLKGHDAGITLAAYSPDGKRIVTSSSAVVMPVGGVFYARVNPTVRVWDAVTGSQLHAVTLGGISSLALSPDCQRIVTSSGDHTAKVWEVASGKELLTLKGHIDAIWSASYSRDGQRIVTASLDGTAKVWEATSGYELFTLKGHGARIFSASFSPDGRRIITGSLDQTAKVWEADSGKELLTLKGHVFHTLNEVAFSPDGQRIVIGGGRDGTAKVWEAATAQQVAAWQSEENAAVEHLAVLVRERAAEVERQEVAESLGVALLAQKKSAEAEPLLRESLDLRLRTAPFHWRTSNARSLLGGALSELKRFDAAEPLLLEGYEGLNQREASLPEDSRFNIREAVERLVQLYEAWGKPAQAAEWKQKLEALPKSE